MNWQEITYWNSKSYGKAIKIKAKYLRVAFIVLCLITPATNWMIPLAAKINNQILRY